MGYGGWLNTIQELSLFTFDISQLIPKTQSQRAAQNLVVCKHWEPQADHGGKGDAGKWQSRDEDSMTGSVPPSSLPSVYAKRIVRVCGSPICAVNVCWTRRIHAVLCKDRFLFCIQVHSSIYTWPYVHISVPHRVSAGMNVNKLYIYCYMGLLVFDHTKPIEASSDLQADRALG